MSEVKIEIINNGAIIKYKEDDIESSTAFIYNENDLKGLQELFYSLLEIIGPCSGKYDRERLEMKIVHGSGYECKDRQCPICKNKED